MSPLRGPATKVLKGYSAWLITRTVSDAKNAIDKVWQAMLVANQRDRQARPILMRMRIEGDMLFILMTTGGLRRKKTSDHMDLPVDKQGVYSLTGRGTDRGVGGNCKLFDL